MNQLVYNKSDNFKPKSTRRCLNCFNFIIFDENMLNHAKLVNMLKLDIENIRNFYEIALNICLTSYIGYI